MHKKQTGHKPPPIDRVHLAPLLGFLLLVKAVSAALCPGSDDERYRSWERRCCGLVHGMSWRCLGCSLVATAVLQGLTLLSRTSSLCDDNPFVQYPGYLSQFTSARYAGLSGTFPATCEPAKGYYMQIAAVVLKNSPRPSLELTKLCFELLV